jgi:hypothetical protein
MIIRQETKVKVVCLKKKCFKKCTYFLIKGIVQRILTGVETRLKRSTLMTYITANYPF